MQAPRPAHLHSTPQINSDSMSTNDDASYLNVVSSSCSSLSSLSLSSHKRRKITLLTDESLGLSYDSTLFSSLSSLDSDEDEIMSELTYEAPPLFVQDHFTNCLDPRIGELPLYSTNDLVGRNSWNMKTVFHSPFPRITKTMELQWYDNRHFWFLGWAQNQRFKEPSLFKVKVHRNNSQDNSVSYKCTTFDLPQKLKPFSEYLDRKIGMWLDRDHFDGTELFSFPEHYNHLYVFDEKSMTLNSHGVSSLTVPPSTLGHAVLNVRINHEDYIYLYGGCCKNSHRAKNDLWVLNLSASKSEWRCITAEASVPTSAFVSKRVYPPRVTNATLANMHGHYLILYGGEYVSEPKKHGLSNEIWFFNMLKEYWFKMPTFTMKPLAGPTKQELISGEYREDTGERFDLLPRWSHAKICTYSHCVIIYGGFKPSGLPDVNLYVYNVMSHHVYSLSIDKVGPGLRIGDIQVTFDLQLKKLLVFGGIPYAFERDKIRDSNEVEYTTVYELDWSTLKSTSTPL